MGTVPLAVVPVEAPACVPDAVAVVAVPPLIEAVEAGSVTVPSVVMGADMVDGGGGRSAAMSSWPVFEHPARNIAARPATGRANRVFINVEFLFPHTQPARDTSGDWGAMEDAAGHFL